MDMQTYNRLAFWEREEISRGLAQSISLKEIATVLGRQPSTIGREIDRVGSSRDYRAELAQEKFKERSKIPKKPKKLDTNPDLKNFVFKHVRLCWSPLTYDRGTEMRQHKLFTRDTNVKVYFAHPYSPWERGTNENTNGLIRQFFPKKTDFSKVTLKEIKRAQDLLNGRPRKVLGWKKPNEVFQNLIALGI